MHYACAALWSCMSDEYTIAGSPTHHHNTDRPLSEK